MSEDDNDGPRTKKQRIYFGSLEEVERERLSKASAPKVETATRTSEDGKSKENGISAAILAGIQAGNINISEGKSSFYFVCVVFCSSLISTAVQ